MYSVLTRSLAKTTKPFRRPRRLRVPIERALFAIVGYLLYRADGRTSGARRL